MSMLFLHALNFKDLLFLECISDSFEFMKFWIDEPHAPFMNFTLVVRARMCVCRESSQAEHRSQNFPHPPALHMVGWERDQPQSGCLSPALVHRLRPGGNPTLNSSSPLIAGSENKESASFTFVIHVYIMIATYSWRNLSILKKFSSCVFRYFLICPPYIGCDFYVP